MQIISRRRCYCCSSNGWKEFGRIIGGNKKRYEKSSKYMKIKRGERIGDKPETEFKFGKVESLKYLATLLSSRNEETIEINQ